MSVSEIGGVQPTAQPTAPQADNRGVVDRVMDGVGNYFSDLKTDGETIGSGIVENEKLYLQLMATAAGGVGTSVIMELANGDEDAGFMDRVHSGVDNYFTSLKDTGTAMGENMAGVFKAEASTAINIMGGIGVSVIDEFI